MRPSLVSLAVVLACVAAPRFAAAEESAAPRSVAVPPIQGTLAADEGARLAARVRARVEGAGYRVVPTETIEMGGADALLEVLVVASEEGCTVRVVTRRAGVASAPGGEANAPCMAAEESRARAIDDAVTQSLASLAVRPPEGAPLPMPDVDARHDAYVFETGIDLDTKAFAGLGHMVAGTDHTAAFRGAFALTVVKNDFRDFDGALVLAIGKNRVEHVRGAFAVGLLGNDVDTFGGIAMASVRSNETRGAFAGVGQVAIVSNAAGAFAGVGQVGVVNQAGRFQGALQLGLWNAIDEDESLAIARVGLYQRSRGASAVEVALATYAPNGIAAGAVVAPVNTGLDFRGGVQVGLLNVLSSRPLDEVFTHSGEGDFQGALQLGVWNAVLHDVAAGAQVGAFNLDRGSARGMLQAGGVNLVHENAELALQVGALNVVQDRFSGFLEAGAVNYARTMHGAQIGAANVGDEIRGVQIGVFNRAKALHGLQIGVLNVADNGVLPFLPVFNAGL